MYILFVRSYIVYKTRRIYTYNNYKLIFKFANVYEKELSNYNSNGEENRSENPDLLIEPPLQVLVRARQFEIMKNRQIDIRHDKANHDNAKANAQIARPVNVDLGRCSQQGNTRNEARY